MSQPKLYEALDVVEDEVCHGCPPSAKPKTCYVVRFANDPDGESRLCSKCLDRQALLLKRARKGRPAQPPAAQMAKPNGPPQVAQVAK